MNVDVKRFVTCTHCLLSDSSGTHSFSLSLSFSSNSLQQRMPFTFRSALG